MLPTKKREKDSKESKFDRNHRGTSDELEVLKLVLENEPGLRRRVLEKMRVIRALSTETALDVAKQIHEKQKKNGPS